MKPLDADPSRARQREAALSIACQAHHGQLDKAGHPYIEHVLRVAQAVSSDPAAEVVALLHDVIEDCPQWRDRVVEAFPDSVVGSVLLLTRDASIPVEAYYAAIRQDPTALKVKLADIADNSDPKRLELLDTATAARLRTKYAKAIRLLGEPNVDK